MNHLVVAFCPNRKHLVHVEPSMDPLLRTIQFAYQHRKAAGW